MRHPLEIELDHRIALDCFATAYSWEPGDRSEFARQGQLSFKRNGRLSFYIHIPFCKKLCEFGKYPHCLTPDDAIQRNYLQIVHRDIRNFLSEYPNITLEGFDIGGGTPTALSPSNFAYLMQIYKEVVHRVNIADDFEPSIAASLTTLTPDKVKMIDEAGIHRLSIDIPPPQTQGLFSNTDPENLDKKQLVEIMKMIRYRGHFKINLGFLYGFNDLLFYEFLDDRSIIDALNPDQVTIYELQTNKYADIKTPDPLVRHTGYACRYKALTEMGYLGEYGRNSFSVDRYDLGMSSFLRHRIFEGHDYKGFGISAQSMSDGDVEYNIGKNNPDILRLIPKGKISKKATFEAKEHYELTNEEKFAEFVCISDYSGGFDWRIAKKRFIPDFFQRFGVLLDFLADNDYIDITTNRIQLTRKGFVQHAAVLSLFYRHNF